MTTDSSPTHLPPVKLAAWLNDRVDGTLVVVETRVSSGDGRLLAIVNTTHLVRNGRGNGRQAL